MRLISFGTAGWFWVFGGFFGLLLFGFWWWYRFRFLLLSDDFGTIAIDFVFWEEVDIAIGPDRLWEFLNLVDRSQ